MRDPYDVLGVARDADDETIKKTFRHLARTCHPDLNAGDPWAEERFKEIGAAYDFLSDSTLRQQYDRGEIDASGKVRRRARQPQGRGPQPGKGSHFGDNVDEILAEMLRRKYKGQGRSQTEPQPPPNRDLRYPLEVPFLEAILGTTKRVELPSGKAVDVKIPPGTSDGQALRLKGQGEGEGDAFIDIKVLPHALFTRREQDILADLPVSVPEAVLGGKVPVPTVDGAVMMGIPSGSNTGTVLRLKGKGVSGPSGRGDQLVTLKVVLPDNDPEFHKLVEKWSGKHSYDPR